MTENRNNLEESPGRFVVCSQDTGICGDTARLAERRGWDVRVATSPEEVCRLLREGVYDVCLIDGEYSQQITAANASAESRSRYCVPTIVLVCPPPTLDGGAVWPTEPQRDPEYDILQRPYSIATLQTLLCAALRRARLKSENRRLKALRHNQMPLELLGRSPQMQQFRTCLEQAAQSDLNVLIGGERGTGIAVLAQMIHAESDRGAKPFLKADCWGVSSVALERGLFGANPPGTSDHTVGAPGLLEQAKGGTLLLDDVHTMALPVQRRLLRGFECIERMGYTEHSNVLLPRILTATPVRLDDRVRERAFLPTLYSRLAECTIRVPALRERREDIDLLATRILADMAAREGRIVPHIGVSAQLVLDNHDWPGNVLELQNVLERACTFENGQELTADMIRPWLENSNSDDHRCAPTMTLKQMERTLIEATFARCHGNREHTARTLKIGLRTLSGKLREYGYPPRGGPGSNRKAA